MYKLLPLFILFSLSRMGNCQSQAGKAGIYNVRDFGARGDGKTLDTRTINKAIDVCSKAGGGVVEFPPGTYLSGSIHLASHIRLELMAGSEILGAADSLHAYDPAEPFSGKAYQDGGHTYFHNSLIWGVGLVDVAITGRGRINGGGLIREDRDVGKGAIGSGDKAIALKSCTNILIRDIIIFHGGHFAILLTGCDLVTLDNLTIDTNRDGIDLDCCTNTMVSNCRINAPYDDAICPKSSFALQRPVATENLMITNCEVSGYEEGSLLDGRRISSPTGSANGRIKFGTESNGGFKNCVVSNCVFRHSKGLALEEVDGGTMEDISISNITMMDVYGYPIYMTLGSRNRGPQGIANGRMRNIHISNIVASNVDSTSGIQITGLPGDDIEGVSLENIRLSFRGGGTQAQASRTFPELAARYPEAESLGSTPSWGLFARHVKELDIMGMYLLTAIPDARPALILTDVNGLDLDHVKVQTVAGIPAARFQKVIGLTMEDAPGLQP
jgi:polygalacturonase